MSAEKLIIKLFLEVGLGAIAKIYGKREEKLLEEMLCTSQDMLNHLSMHTGTENIHFALTCSAVYALIRNYFQLRNFDFYSSQHYTLMHVGFEYKHSCFSPYDNLRVPVDAEFHQHFSNK